MYELEVSEEFEKVKRVIYMYNDIPINDPFSPLLRDEYKRIEKILNTIQDNALFFTLFGTTISLVISYGGYYSNNAKLYILLLYLIYLLNKDIDTFLRKNGLKFVHLNTHKINANVLEIKELIIELQDINKEITNNPKFRNIL